VSADVLFISLVNQHTKKIQQQMKNRCYRAANELRNAAQDVLKGRCSGRLYRVSGKSRRHRASAPGEPPAVDSGKFRTSWESTTQIIGNSYISRIETKHNVNGYTLGSLLEYGTSRMAPRPHHEKIRQKALPKICRIYAEPYF